jgi:hypothetical protein
MVMGITVGWVANNSEILEISSPEIPVITFSIYIETLL